MKNRTKPKKRKPKPPSLKHKALKKKMNALWLQMELADLKYQRDLIKRHSQPADYIG